MAICAEPCWMRRARSSPKPDNGTSRFGRSRGAVAVAGYEALREHTSAAAADEADAVAALTAVGRAYIGFGIANPALYRLMFGRGLSGMGGVSPEVVTAARANRAVVREVIVSGARGGRFTVDPYSQRDIAATVVAAGSLVHGLTLSTIDGIVERVVDKAPVDDLVARVLRRFIVGLTRAE